MKYSKEFERDYTWYLGNRYWCNFCGKDEFYDKHGKNLVVSSLEKTGAYSAKEAFYTYDSTGKILPTYEPTLLHELYVCKAGINLQIGMWADGIKDFKGDQNTYLEKNGKKYVLNTFNIMKNEFNTTIKEKYNLLPWMVDAVNKQVEHE